MTNILEQLSWLSIPFVVTHCSNDKHFLKLAYGYGNSTSPDPSTKNGAVLVGSDNKIIVYGTNKFPNGIAETQPRLNNKFIKYATIIHAENETILNAARLGKSTNNSVLYCPFLTCSECAKAIIQAGINKIVGHAQLMAIASTHTVWTESIRHGLKMTCEAGIKCALFDGTIGIMTRLNNMDIEV